MPTEKRHKIIITGSTGHAGAALLVGLFTELGLDTGYTRATFQRDYPDHDKSGLERDVEDPRSPAIVKNSALSERLPTILAHGEISIDFAVIPVCHLDNATRNRSGADGSGRRATAAVPQSKAGLAENFHQLVETLTVHDIPHAFLHFPRFVQDPRYTYAKLQPMLRDISYEQFEHCFELLAKPEPVAATLESPPVKTAAPVKAFRRSSWRRRAQRKVSRTAGFLTCFALGCLAPWSMASKRPVITSAPTVAPGVDIAALKQVFSRTPRTWVSGNGSLRPPPPPDRGLPPGFHRFALGRAFRIPAGLSAFRFPPMGFFAANVLRSDPEMVAEKSFLGAELFMR